MYICIKLVLFTRLLFIWIKQGHIIGNLKLHSCYCVDDLALKFDTFNNTEGSFIDTACRILLKSNPFRAAKIQMPLIIVHDNYIIYI